MSGNGIVGRAGGREEAHRPPGILHLAVSAQIEDPDGSWLLQRRADGKAAFTSCWANTCCTHPHVDEDPAAAAVRCLWEDAGLEASSLSSAATFVCRAADPGSGLAEHEFDHVLVAVVTFFGAGRVGALWGSLR